MRRVAWWSLFGLLVAFVAVDVLLMIAAVSDAAEGPDRGGEIGAVVVLLLIGGGLGLAAWRVAHHVRDGHPRENSVARARAGEVGHSRPAPPLSRFERSQRRARRSPGRSALALVVLFVLLASFETAETTTAFSKWRRSVFTQAHGVPSTLTVERAVRVLHSEDHGGYHTVHLQGALLPPVDGRARTTVFTPNDATYTDGEQVAVLVDPHDPAHAELPGLLDYSFAGVAWQAIFAVVMYLLAIFFLVVSGINRFRSWRSRLTPPWRRRRQRN